MDDPSKEAKKDRREGPKPLFFSRSSSYGGGKHLDPSTTCQNRMMRKDGNQSLILWVDPEPISTGVVTTKEGRRTDPIYDFNFLWVFFSSRECGRPRFPPPTPNGDTKNGWKRVWCLGFPLYFGLGVFIKIRDRHPRSGIFLPA